MIKDTYKQYLEVLNIYWSRQGGNMGAIIIDLPQVTYNIYHIRLYRVHLETHEFEMANLSDHGYYIKSNGQSRHTGKNGHKEQNEVKQNKNIPAYNTNKKQHVPNVVCVPCVNHGFNMCGSRCSWLIMFLYVISSVL